MGSIPIVSTQSDQRLTSYGVRHTEATHMVQQATDLGELRAIAYILCRSPEMLMNTYAYALPISQLSVVDRIANRPSINRGRRPYVPSSAAASSCQDG